MEKKKCAYILATSQNIVWAAANVALELNRYMPNEEFDILIYHRGLEEKDVKALSKIKNVILKEFITPDGFEETILKNMPKGRLANKNSLLTFAHYEVFNVLDEYKSAIWLDIDTSIQGDISKLQTYGPIGMPEDKHDTGIFPVQINFVKPVPNYNMEASAYCTAVVVATDALKNAKEIYQWCINKSMELAEYLITPDQGIIQLALQHFKLKVNVFPFEEYTCFASWPMAHLAKIAHFGTSAKVWNTPDLYQAFPQWLRTHLEYVAMGGSDFDRSKLPNHAIIVDYRNVNKENEKLVASINNTASTTNLKQGYKKKIYLFDIIPLFSIKNNPSVLKFKFLGLPIFEKKIAKRKLKIKILGILPLIKIKNI